MSNEINILLIEDNPGDVRLVQEVLKETTDLQIKLNVADNLSQGRKIIATQLIHVILLDLNLPDSEGIETFKHVFKFATDVPIIILSVLSDKELIYQALKLGAQDYLIKGSIKNEAIVRAIRYAIWCHHHPA